MLASLGYNSRLLTYQAPIYSPKLGIRHRNTSLVYGEMY